MESRPPDVVQYLLALSSWRRFILATVAVVSLVAAGVTLILPQWFKATASVMPPKEQNPLGMLGNASSLLRNISSASRGMSFSSGQGRYNYMAILNSRRAMEEVAQRFDLARVYEIADSSMEETLKALSGNCEFELQEDDYITISVSDRDPVRAAEMANYFVTVLNSISTELGTMEARNNRVFIEGAVQRTMARLTTYEDSLKRFQERSGMLLIPDENSASVEAVAEVYAYKTKKEIEVAILERTVGNDNPALVQARVELDELTRRVDKIPEIGLATLRLYRDVVIQQKVLEFLVPLVEQARVEEHKTTPVTVLLDKAYPPEKKDRPRRMIIVIVSALSAFLLSITYALTVERLRVLRAERPEIHERLRSFFVLRQRDSNE